MNNNSISTEKTPALDLEALKVDVHLLNNPKGKLIGLATVEYHGFYMDNFKIFNGENGMFLGEPTIRDAKSNGFIKTIRVKGDELREALNQKALEGYNTAVEKLIARADEAKNMEVKPSVQKQMADGAKQAADYNTTRSTPIKGSKTKSMEV